MTKKELIDKASLCALPKLEDAIESNDVSKIFDCLLLTMEKSLLKEGAIVVFPGIGIFKMGKCKARRARNPKTGETINIPERNCLKFKPSAAFKEKMKEIVSEEPKSEEKFD